MTKHLFTRLLLITIIVLSTVNTFSQHLKPTRDSIAIKEANALKKRLNLSENQYSKLISACMAHEINKANFNMQKSDSTTRTKGLSIIAEKYRKALKQILSTEQFAGYEQLIEKRKQRFRTYSE